MLRLVTAEGTNIATPTPRDEATVLEVAHIIRNAHFTGAGSIKLICNGKMLDETLKWNAIPPNAFIVVVVKPLTIPPLLMFAIHFCNNYWGYEAISLSDEKLTFSPTFLSQLRDSLETRRSFVTLFVNATKNPVEIGVMVRPIKDLVTGGTDQFGLDSARIAKHFDSTQVVPIIVSCIPPPLTVLMVHRLPWSTVTEICSCCGATKCVSGQRNPLQRG